MITTYRPLTAKQKAMLQGYIAWHIYILRAFLFCLPAIGLGALLRSLANAFLPENIALFWPLPVLIFMAWLYTKAGQWTGGHALRKKIREDIKNGVAAVHGIDVVDAIKVQEKEDEGPSYFLKTTDGKVLLLSGQYLTTSRMHGFPWTSFEITEAPLSKEWFGIKKTGSVLNSVFIRQPFDYEEAKQYAVKNYDFFDLDFDSLKIKQP